MRQLRKKLEADPERPQYILTEPGLGYRFIAGPAPGAAPVIVAYYDADADLNLVANAVKSSCDAADGVVDGMVNRFQAELDQVRTHVALWMFHAQGADNEAVARYLGFHDAANFRRSFKRWTGVIERAKIPRQ